MEDQAKYQVKESAEWSPLDPKRHYREYRQQQDHERPFHGDYLQSKRDDLNNAAIIIFAYLAAIFFGIMFFIGLWTTGLWLWNLLTAAV